MKLSYETIIGNALIESIDKKKKYILSENSIEKYKEAIILNSPMEIEINKDKDFYETNHELFEIIKGDNDTYFKCDVHFYLSLYNRYRKYVPFEIVYTMASEKVVEKLFE